jgi:hypothetical protein
MANTLGADSENKSTYIKPTPATQQQQRHHSESSAPSHQDNIHELVTGKAKYSQYGKDQFLSRAFSQDKFKAVEKTEKIQDDLENDIHSTAKEINDIMDEMEQFGYQGDKEEMNALLIDTAVGQIKKQVYSKLRTGKLALSPGLGELAAGADIGSRVLEMNGGFHVGKTHDDIDAFWDKTKLDYVPVIGGIANSMSHVIGSIYNNLAVNAFGKESDGEHLDKLKYKLRNAEQRLNGIYKDIDKLHNLSTKWVNEEKGRYNSERREVEDILNKDTRTKHDQAVLNLAEYRDYY